MIRDLFHYIDSRSHASLAEDLILSKLVARWVLFQTWDLKEMLNIIDVYGSH